MTKDRKELIEKFEKWLSTKPAKNIIAAQCANIAEDYAKKQLSLLHSSIQLPNDNNDTPYMDDLVNFRSFGIDEVSNTNLIEFYEAIIEEIHRRKNK
jgi:hypothetical protein